MRVLRSGTSGKWMFGVSALVFIGVIWLLFFRTPPESWQLLTTVKLVKIEAEQAIYQKSNLPDYFVRVRITNLSSKPVSFDRYENARASSRLGQPFQANCYLTEGDYPAPVNRWIPLLVSDIKTMEQAARTDFQKNKLPQIMPGKAQEFFIAMPEAKTQISRSWKSFPLWWKSKVFLPQDSLRSPFLVVLFNGQLTVTNGKDAQVFGFRKEYFALRFPVKTKSLP